MNITEFNKKFLPIQAQIEETYCKLNFASIFPDKMKLQFNRSLEGILELLNEDTILQQTSTVSWHMARRIVGFSKLIGRIGQIQKKMWGCAPTPSIYNKIRLIVLPLLRQRVKELKQTVGTKGRLPFETGNQRTEVYQIVKKNLQPDNFNTIKEVEKEYFHLLAEYFNSPKLLEIDRNFYEANSEIYSLESWIQLLNEFIKEGSQSEREKGKSLLSIIQRAVPLSIKTSFIGTLPQTSKPNDQQELTYFEDFVHQNEERSYRSTFSKKYQLTDSCTIPESVLVNEIAWDILHVVNRMEKGEKNLFLLGLMTHAIAIEIFCTDLPLASSSQREYRYTIFNTGQGVNQYHQLDDTQKFAYPLVFDKVPQKALSYSFIEELLRISLSKNKSKDFYDFHEKVLLQEYGANKLLEIGPLYLIQKYGTCSYLAIEAWIKNYLDENEKKHFEIIKTRMSIDKQEKIISLIEQAHPSICYDSKTKFDKLTESRILLELGKDYLKTLNQTT